MLFLVAELAVVAVSSIRPQRAAAAQAPQGQGFTVTPGDLAFILKQIKISEHHAQALRDDAATNTDPCHGLVGPGPNQVPDRLTPFGLRTVGGECNNLFPAGSVGNRPFWAASDQLFPRLAGPGFFREAESVPTGFPVSDGTPATGNTTYASKKGDVIDSQPRVISNLVVDQTSTNPAAIAAAGLPVRSQDPTPSSFPCDAGGDPTAADPDGTPNGCTPSHKTLFIPNVTTDVGLSPPFNSVFTFFGQFFDHGVDQTVKSGSTVFVPLKADDPLRTLGPDGIPDAPTGQPGSHDAVPASRAFMMLTRAKNQPGGDGILGDDPDTDVDESADDVQEATNTDTPLVDQSQTYTSHASHQAFLREYELDTNRHPVNTGKLLGDPERALGPDGEPGTVDDLNDSGMSTWASVKKQAAEKLGLQLQDKDATNIPMLAVDPYGNIIPGPARGLAQYVTKAGPLVEGVLDDPATTTVNEAIAVPDNAVFFDTPFLTDIAHNADMSPTPPSTTVKTPDADLDVNPVDQPRPSGTFDNELLDTHFTAGDGRVNENIALTAVHQIFHSEHDRLVDDIKRILTEDARPDVDGGTATGRAALPEWQITAANGGGAGGWNGARLFQAARFITEMEYQHLVFEDFARKIVPAIRPFHIYHSDGNPVVPAEFAHAVYRFGHSMLDDDVARTNADGTKNDVKLLTAFLNPQEYFRGGAAGTLTPQEAAGSIFMGSADQAGNEIDEFVTETLRNNLLGLPLDLPTINMTRAREAGVPPLNVLRRRIFAETNDSSLKPYTDWSDYGQHLKHPESLINYVAAYGQHPSITGAGGYVARRAAARAIVDPRPATATTPADVPPGDAADFMFGTGPFWSTHETGINDVDTWVGGLGEVTNVFGGLLGSTFNYVFQHTLEALQENDRFYYLNRTPGLNLRNQLEGNSFSELVLRNTQGTDTFKSDAFGTADCKFNNLSAITFPFNGTNTVNADGQPVVKGAGSVNDVPASECDENQLLLRKPDGTFQYRLRNNVDPPGINGQSVFQGNAVVDKVFAGNDNDTLWGARGNDILNGGGGDDVVFGGEDNDVIQDLDGADILEGGAQNDALDAGPGDDLILGGDGVDFSNGGLNDNETFAGPGDDFLIAGTGADAIFGDGGSDWVEGGSGQDLLQGDHGAPFFDDPGEAHPGHEIMIGQDGENDYDVEGGDDLMSQNAHVDRNAGAGGFDWAFHQYDTVGAEDDMMINNFLDNVPLPVVVNRDRWQETEADSGSPFNDTIKGTKFIHGEVGGAGDTGCDALDADGVARITGLNQLVTTLPRPLAGVEAIAAAGKCPLTGNVWAEGDILIGGGGGDTIEGRAGDDIIDGDRALHVRITAPSVANPGQTLSTDLMEGKPKNPADGSLVPNGTFGPAGSSMTLQEAVFAGLVDPGDLRMVREIVTEPTPLATIDTALFSGPVANYTITQPSPGVVRVADGGGAGPDGTDTLTGIENLRFTDGDFTVAPSGTLAPAAGVSADFGTVQVGTTTANRLFTVTNTGALALSLASPAGSTTGANAADFVASNPATGACGTTLAAGQSCSVQARFAPTSAGSKSADLVVKTSGGAVLASIPLTGAATAAPPQVPPTGVPAVTFRLGPLANVLQPGSTLTANNGTLADSNGIRSVAWQWQQTAVNGTTFSDIATATAASFTIPATPIIGNPNRCRAFRVAAIVTDNTGKVEARVFSASTPRVPPLVGTCTTPAPALAAPTAPLTTPLGQATAPPLAPARLAAGAVRVAGTSSTGLSVSTTVPAGASTVAISLFRLNSVVKRTSKARQKPSSVHIATVYRKTTKAKRYVFRLTEKPFRHLKPGRYLVQVRVGTSRTTLGPAASRQHTIRKARSHSAR